MEPRASYTSRPRSARPHPTLHIPTLFLPPRPYLLPTSPPSPMSLTCSPAPSPRSQVALWRHESQSSGKPWKVSTFLLPFSTWLFAFPSSPPVRIWSPRSKLFPTPSSSCTCRQHQQARIQSGRVYLPSMFHRLRQATMAQRRLLVDVPPVHRHRQGAPPSDPLVVGTPDPAARAKPAAPRRGSWGECRHQAYHAQLRRREDDAGQGAAGLVDSGQGPGWWCDAYQGERGCGDAW
jgi:hypothetical protein